MMGQMFPGQDFSGWGAYNQMMMQNGWDGYSAPNMMGTSAPPPPRATLTNTPP